MTGRQMKSKTSKVPVPARFFSPLTVSLSPASTDEKLEKARSTLYDAHSYRDLSLFYLTSKLHFGNQTLKSIPILFLILITFYGSAWGYSDDDDESLPHVEIKTVSNLQQLGQLAKQQQKVIFLEMSASYCGYCKTLEENIIKPMLRSGAYDDYVLFRKLNIDSHYTLIDFDGSKTSPARYSYKLNASLTPTLLFMDNRGTEISERILGVNTLELYGQYVDDALLEGLRSIKQKQPLSHYDNKPQ